MLGCPRFLSQAVLDANCDMCELELRVFFGERASGYPATSSETSNPAKPGYLSLSSVTMPCGSLPMRPQVSPSRKVCPSRILDISVAIPGNVPLGWHSVSSLLYMPEDQVLSSSLNDVGSWRGQTSSIAPLRRPTFQAG